MFHLYIIRKYSQALKQRNSFSGRMCITPITAWSSPQETEILITSYYAIPPSMRMYGTVHKSLRCFSPQIIFEPNKKSVRYLFPPQFFRNSFILPLLSPTFNMALPPAPHRKKRKKTYRTGTKLFRGDTYDKKSIHTAYVNQYHHNGAIGAEERKRKTYWFFRKCHHLLSLSVGKGFLFFPYKPA